MSFVFVPLAFRMAFPEFNDITRYPDAQLNFWAGLAVAQVNCVRWGSQTYMGVFLYVAHTVTLAAGNEKTAFAGGAPGAQSGPANSKTVGSATIAYDTIQTEEKDAGWWNLTSYGKTFIRLARTFGAGGVQL